MQLLLPAPRETRDATPVRFYAIEIADPANEPTVTLSGLDDENAEHARGEIRLLDDHGFSAVISLGERELHLDASMSPAENTDGVADPDTPGGVIEGYVERQPFKISGRGEDAHVVTDARFSAQDQALIEPWALLADPLDVLSSAMRVRQSLLFDDDGSFACGVLASSIAVSAASILIVGTGGLFALTMAVSYTAVKAGGYSVAC